MWHDIGLGEGKVLAAGDLCSKTAGRSAVIHLDQAAFGHFAQHRSQCLFGGGELAAHIIYQPDITLYPAHQPVEAVDILLVGERGEQRARAGIVVGVVERFHRRLQKQLRAFARACAASLVSWST